MAAAEYNIKTHAKLTAIIDIPSCLYYNKLKEALIKSCTSDAQSDLCKQMTCKAVRRDLISASLNVNRNLRRNRYYGCFKY